MATTISFINQKGGCGKSSSCLHVAGAFAADGLRVLLVDLDPQGSLGQGFLGSEIVENVAGNETIALLFDEGSFFAERGSLLRTTPFERITLCIANHHLSSFNTPAPETTGMLQFAVRDFIHEEADVFDIVLIDCPPNLYRCSWTAALASQHVVIPVPPEDFGTQGLRAVHQMIEQAQMLNAELRPAMHLITRRDRRLSVHRAYADRLRQLYGSSVLTTEISELSAFKIALAHRSPVQYSNEDSIAASLTRTLAREILDRINEESRAWPLSESRAADRKHDCRSRWALTAPREQAVDVTN